MNGNCPSFEKLLDLMWNLVLKAGCQADFLDLIFIIKTGDYIILNENRSIKYSLALNNRGIFSYLSKIFIIAT